jgi:transglutaminase-like putative cysteine protease
VAVAIAACWSQGELGLSIALPSIALVVAGNVLSYRRRARPVRFLKLVLAVAVLAAFGWFFVTISSTASAGDLTSVEGPLAVLFTFIQVTHAFDVPSRRDLGFSLAGSATLMAVAAAQSVDDSFGLYVLAWAALGLTGLLAMWGSMVGGSRLRPVTVAVVAGAVLSIGFAMVAVLPAPHANSSLVLPSAIADDLPVNSAAGLVGGGAKGTEPVHAGSTAARTRMGGFLGFAGPLDTAIRATLGTEVVLRVRADRPTFWVAETFNEWTGQSWEEAAPPKDIPEWREISTGSPFTVPSPVGEASQGAPDFQTFYLNEAGPNLVFHAADATEVWFPARRMFVGPYGTIRSGTSMGPGSIYTVLSNVDTATPAELEAAGTSSVLPGETLSPAIRAQSLQLPRPYRRAADLAARVTAHAPTVYAKVVALEDWIGAHTKYTTDIPPLAPGQDTVNEFLFGNRRGYCEQISTALAVMLRTLGIPTREATGYVPGPYDPITDLYEVQADDAHAWVQVWFPGYGWQSFDPTAYVPLANPSPAAAIGHDIADALRRVPAEPVVAVVAGLAVVALFLRRRRRAPATWAGAVTRELEGAARRARLAPQPGETLARLGAGLDARRPPHAHPPPHGVSPHSAYQLAVQAERAAYRGTEPDPATRRELLRAARRLKRGARRLRRPVVPTGRDGTSAFRGPGARGGTGGVSPGGGGPGPPPSSPRQSAGAGRT